MYSRWMQKNEQATAVNQERGEPHVNKGGVAREGQAEEHAGLTTCWIILNSTLTESTLEGKEGPRTTLGFQAWVTGKIMVPLKVIGMRKLEAGWKVRLLFLGNTHLSGGVQGYKYAYGRKSGPELCRDAGMRSRLERWATAEAS